MGIWLWEHIQFKTINFDKNSIKWNITNSFCGILSLEITLVWYYQVHCLSFFTKWKKKQEKNEALYGARYSTPLWYMEYEKKWHHFR